MTWDLRAEEREAVSKLDAPERYGYFVKRVADWEEVWGCGTRTGGRRES